MFSKDSLFIECYNKSEYENCSVYIGRPKKNFIKDYVVKYDSDFYEPLSKRVNLETFSQKISDLSTTFILVSENKIAGLIIAYFYEPESLKGFITLTHTKSEYRGKHFARILLDSVKSYAKDNNFKYIDLGVYKDNKAAYNLYLHFGFKVLQDDNFRCNMRYEL